MTKIETIFRYKVTVAGLVFDDITTEITEVDHERIQHTK